MWTACVGTLFPSVFPGPLGISCIGKSLGQSWNLEIDDLRSFATDKHKTVDDAPFGGGGGMLIKCEIVDSWFNLDKNKSRQKIYVSPRGNLFNQEMVPEFISKDICILCGRYEGVDMRVLQHWNVQEISIGDFILHGGETAAMCIIETCARYLTIKKHSLIDTFSNNLLEHDQYTRPAQWVPKGNSNLLDKNETKTYNVPEVLISGDHAKVRDWKLQNSENLTRLNRPDLWKKYLEGKK